MSLFFLASLLIAGVVHWRFVERARWPGGAAELLLVYVLVGYCGLFMLGAGALDFAASLRQSTVFPFPVGSTPVQQFFDLALLGMASVAVSSIWFRGRYLIAPVVCWSIFWLGATYVHLADDLSVGSIGCGRVLLIFLTHGFVAVLLAGLFVISRRSLRQPKGAE